MDGWLIAICSHKFGPGQTKSNIGRPGLVLSEIIICGENFSSHNLYIYLKLNCVPKIQAIVFKKR